MFGWMARRLVIHTPSGRARCPVGKALRGGPKTRPLGRLPSPTHDGQPLPCPGAQRCTKQLASERSSSALCTTASQNQGIGPSRPQGCGGARDGRRVPQGRPRKKIPASLFSVEKTKCLPHTKPMICNQARRPSTNSQRRQNDSGHPGIGLEQLSNEGKIILKGDK